MTTEPTVDVVALVKMLGAVVLVDADLMAKRIEEQVARRRPAKKAVRS